MDRIERIVEDMLKNVDQMDPAELIKKRDTCKVAIEFVSLKLKKADEDASGAMFKEDMKDA